MDKRKREHSKPEINSGEVLVQTAGYISKERRIKSLMWAGKRIEELRSKGAFDVLPGEKVNIDQLRIDPTRSKGYDLSDAHKDLAETAKRIKDRKERYDAQKLEEKNVQSSKEKEKKEPEGSQKEA